MTTARPGSAGLTSRSSSTVASPDPISCAARHRTNATHGRTARTGRTTISATHHTLAFGYASTRMTAAGAPLWMPQARVTPRPPSSATTGANTSSPMPPQTTHAALAHHAGVDDLPRQGCQHRLTSPDSSARRVTPATGHAGVPLRSTRRRRRIQQRSSIAQSVPTHAVTQPRRNPRRPYYQRTSERNT